MALIRDTASGALISPPQARSDAHLMKHSCLVRCLCCTTCKLHFLEDSLQCGRTRRGRSHKTGNPKNRPAAAAISCKEGPSLWIRGMIDPAIEGTQQSWVPSLGQHADEQNQACMFALQVNRQPKQHHHSFTKQQLTLWW